MYPGQFPSVKANLFNVILVLDLSKTSSVNFIAGAMANILERNIPLRFGLVPVVETEESKLLLPLAFFFALDVVMPQVRRWPGYSII